MSNTLLPCPFCGGEAIVVKTERCGRYIGCWDCGGRTEEFETDYAGSAHDKAIAAWNRRADRLPDATKMVSNADRIRSMSDKELARWLVGATVCERVCDEDEYCHGNECVKRVTDWLQRPEATIVYCDGCGKSTTTDEIHKQMGGTKKWTSYGDGNGGPQQHYCPDCRGEI